jgi:hypothetical protein
LTVHWPFGGRLEGCLGEEAEYNYLEDYRFCFRINEENSVIAAYFVFMFKLYIADQHYAGGSVLAAIQGGYTM